MKLKPLVSCGFLFSNGLFPVGDEYIAFIMIISSTHCYYLFDKELFRVTDLTLGINKL